RRASSAGGFAIRRRGHATPARAVGRERCGEARSLCACHGTEDEEFGICGQGRPDRTHGARISLTERGGRDAAEYCVWSARKAAERRRDDRINRARRAG